MALPITPGTSISLNQVNVELGNSGTATISLNADEVRVLAGIPGSGNTISMADLSGASAGAPAGPLSNTRGYLYTRGENEAPHRSEFDTVTFTLDTTITPDMTFAYMYDIVRRGSGKIGLVTLTGDGDVATRKLIHAVTSPWGNPTELMINYVEDSIYVIARAADEKQTGSSTFTQFGRAWIAKYNSSWVLQWQTQFNNPDNQTTPDYGYKVLGYDATYIYLGTVNTGGYDPHLFRINKSNGTGHTALNYDYFYDLYGVGFTTGTALNNQLLSDFPTHMTLAGVATVKNGPIDSTTIRQHNINISAKTNTITYKGSLTCNQRGQGYAIGLVDRNDRNQLILAGAHTTDGKAISICKFNKTTRAVTQIRKLTFPAAFHANFLNSSALKMFEVQNDSNLIVLTASESATVGAWTYGAPSALVAIIDTTDFSVPYSVLVHKTPSSVYSNIVIGPSFAGGQVILDSTTGSFAMTAFSDNHVITFPGTGELGSADPAFYDAGENFTIINFPATVASESLTYTWTPDTAPDPTKYTAGQNTYYTATSTPPTTSTFYTPTTNSTINYDKKEFV